MKPLKTTLIACLLIAPLTFAANGGGEILNVAPTIDSFAGDFASGFNDQAHVEVFTWSTADDNGPSEAITGIFRIFDSGAQQFHTSTQVAGAALVPGWSVTSQGNGAYDWSYTYTWATGTPGDTYSIYGYVDDGAGEIQSGIDQTVIGAQAIITLNNGDLVDVNCNIVAAGPAYNSFTAIPSSTDAGGIYYLAVQNTGGAAGSVSLQFGGTNFVHTVTPSNTIAIDGNIRYEIFREAALDGTCDLTRAPDVTDSETSGSLTLSVSPGDWYIVGFELLAIGTVDGGDYQQTYTWTEL